MIRIQDLWCGYAGQRVLKGISLTIGKGEFVGILGPNGCGKTTLLLALSGIMPLQQGKVEVMGHPVGHLPPRERARLMAAVCQDGDVRFPFLCREVVRMGRYPHQHRWQLDSMEDETAVKRAMELTDTEQLAHRLATAISGGERQRVMVARALAQETPILILDEATSAMDVHRKLQIFRVLDQLNRETGLTILSVLHDVNLAALFCQRILFMKEGQILADGPTPSVLVPEIVEKVYQTPVIVQDIGDTGKRQVIFLP